MLSHFPKKRPVLPPAYQAIYEEYYASNRAGDGVANNLAQKLEAWMHRIVAARGRLFLNRKILDFGCGNLNHFQYESDVEVYDAVEPFSELYQNQLHKDRISNFYEFVHDIEHQEYDRVFSVAVLEHLTDLPRDIAKCALLVKKDGVFQAGIPCEGEFAWKLGWQCSTGLSFRKRYNLDYGIFMRHEHVNTMDEIINVVNEFFEGVKITRSPIPFPVPHMSFYAYIEATDPKLSAAREFLNK